MHKIHLQIYYTKEYIHIHRKYCYHIHTYMRVCVYVYGKYIVKYTTLLSVNASNKRQDIHT